MQPIGLTLKNIRNNSFTGETSGEIMIVHQCLSCGRISCNRIAGDDNPYSIINLLNDSENIQGNMKGHLEEKGILILCQADKMMVARSLFGNQYEQYI